MMLLKKIGRTQEVNDNDSDTGGHLTELIRQKIQKEEKKEKEKNKENNEQDNEEKDNQQEIKEDQTHTVETLYVPTKSRKRSNSTSHQVEGLDEFIKKRNKKKYKY